MCMKVTEETNIVLKVVINIFLCGLNASQLTYAKRFLIQQPQLCYPGNNGNKIYLQ
jgi:hypothetical protein